MLALPVIFIVIHFIGDFICQTDWMAINKSKSWMALLTHVLVYTWVLFIGTTLFVLYLGYPDLGLSLTLTIALPPIVLWVSLNGALHFITDAITSRWTASLWKREQRHWFFVVIGLDQVIHYTTLAVTLEWLSRM